MGGRGGGGLGKGQKYDHRERKAFFEFIDHQSLESVGDRLGGKAFPGFSSKAGNLELRIYMSEIWEASRVVMKGKKGKIYSADCTFL